MRADDLRDFATNRLGFIQAANNTLGVHYRLSWKGLGQGTVAIMLDPSGDAMLLVDVKSELGEALQNQWVAGKLPKPAGALPPGTQAGQHFVWNGLSLLDFLRQFKALP
jgi:hypothetical protein